MESIRENGVLTPVLIRPTKKNEYEMISGHRRIYAAKLAGLTTIPAIVREMEEDDAVIAMVDANIQREELLPSERAFAYKMKMDAMKRQGARSDLDITSTQNGWKCETAELIGQQVGESKNQIRRYIRLTELIPKLLDMVDNKKLQFTVAVEISYIDKEVQEWIYEYICENGFIKPKQISTLREYLKKETMNQNKMIYLLNSCIENKNVSRKVMLSEKKLKKYFPTFYSSSDMEEVIVKLLEEWKKEQEEK